MLRISIKPTTFSILPIQDGQNKYIDIDAEVNNKKALSQHTALEKSFKAMITYTIETPTKPLPDVVFIANGGLCLPLPKPTILLPNMKYPQRREELPYLKAIYNDLGIDTMEFPGNEPFEGQAELKWFHNGTKAICGYGFRSTKKTFDEVNTLFKKLFKDPPELLVVHLKCKDYYHLDVAMLEFDNKCVIHKRAFSEESVKRVREFLGKDNVFIIDTKDSFCLNAVVDGDRLITHMLNKEDKDFLEGVTKKKIHMVDTSEFQKSGGSVRCMTLDVFSGTV